MVDKQHRESRDRYENHLLLSLPEKDYHRLRKKMEPVDLAFHQTLYNPNEAIKDVYFVTRGVVSLLSVMKSGQAVELATVGNEGMVGVPAIFGAQATPTKAVAQTPGNALRMDAKRFAKEMKQPSELSDIIHRYTVALLTQFAQTAGCNALHPVKQRAARWLLITQDRLKSEEYPITQQFLAEMMAVRRASVSEVAGELQREGFVSYRQGKMKITNRKGLESVACECYWVVKKEFDWLLGNASPKRPKQ